MKVGNIIGYEITFINETDAALYDIELVDTRVDSNIKLVPANTAGCTYADYNGDQDPGGTSPSFLSLNDSTATWNSLDELPAGEDVTVHMCAEVLADTEGDEVSNNVCATYAAEDNAEEGDRAEVCTLTLQLVDSGTPTAVSLASLAGAQSSPPAAAIAASLLALLSLTVLAIWRKTSG